MNTPKVTPKDFFLWLGAMAALYGSTVAFVALVFDYLNAAFPETLQYYSGDPYSSGMSYEMATLIVLFPLFLVLMRVIRRGIAEDATRDDIWVRRWALFLTLFIAGATLAGDLITLIMYFLNGDVTLRFALKALVILLVAGAGFLHFLADLRGYWNANPGKARLVGVATGALALITIISGFFIVGTPWEARLYRYDDQKVSDLQSLQYQIVNYWQAKERLPIELSELQDPISGFIVPNDPQSGMPYTYTATGKLSFKLCASFNAETQPYAAGARSVPIAPEAFPSKMKEDTWQHGTGEVCFDRTIDPQLYPPLRKQ